MIDKDTIIRLAREAGGPQIIRQFHGEATSLFTLDGLERFAQSIYRQGLEDAANLVQLNAQACSSGSMVQVYLASNAAAIRKMKEPT